MGRSAADSTNGEWFLRSAPHTRQQRSAPVGINISHILYGGVLCWRMCNKMEWLVAKSGLNLVDDVHQLPALWMASPVAPTRHFRTSHCVTASSGERGREYGHTAHDGKRQDAAA